MNNDEIKKLLQGTLLGTAYHRLDFQRVNYEQQMEKLFGDKTRVLYNRVREKHDKILTRIKDQKKIHQFISKLNFIPSIPPEIEKCVNDYWCFCDRYNFYYDPDFLNQHDWEQITQICFCEILNSLQDYFIRKSLPDKIAHYYEGTSIVAMSNIGILKNEPPYSTSVRPDLLQNYNSKYSLVPIIAFTPNMHAASYLFNRLLFNDPENRIGFYKKVYETADVEEYRYNIIYISDVGTYGFSWREEFNLNFSYRVYYQKLANGKMKRVTGHTNLVKSHKDAVSIANTLAGID